MSKKIVMGYWDCQYCDTKGIEGTKRECSGCGHPRGDGVKFYMDKSNMRYLTRIESQNKGKGPDWLCSYCNSLNSAIKESCTSCGASKSSSEKNYFEMHNMHSRIADTSNNNIETSSDFSSNVEYTEKVHEFDETSVFEEDFETVNEAKSVYASYKEPFNSNERTFPDVLGSMQQFFSRFGIPLLGIMAIICFIIAMIPRSKEFTPETFSWVYDIDIESYETVEESDWSLPTGARLDYTEEEIHHYDKVVDHYETKTRTYTEQVPDGYDISYTYSDNGDGTFTEHEIKTPKYRTEYREEQYEEPVYKDVPVYQTKYYYEIDKWVYKRSVTTSSNDKEPYWGDVVLGHKEREGSHHESYHITGIVDDKTVTYTCSKAIWEQLSEGTTYKIKVSLNTIIEVE